MIFYGDHYDDDDVDDHEDGLGYVGGDGNGGYDRSG